MTFMKTVEVGKLMDLAECWNREADQCDAKAKKIGGGWAARAETLRDCAKLVAAVCEVKP